MHQNWLERFPLALFSIGAFSTDTPSGCNVSDSGEAPDIDPVLSSGALKINPKKLEKVPWDHTGDHPGSNVAWAAIKALAALSKSYIFRNNEEERPVNSKGGRVYASMHINGLIDPLCIILSQEKRPITMGRHDLATMPFIGWLTRRMGNQPVIRRAEQASGIVDSEYSKSINHRTLLTMAHCISGGHGAVVMPEGKSHQDSKLHHLRTGAMRFSLNAAAIADAKGLPPPTIQPVGLHFRCHHWFRTDVYVEYAEPLEIPVIEDPTHAANLIDGIWSEPPEEKVLQLRDELYGRLSPITPDAPDWETYRAWHLLGHLRSKSRGVSLTKYSEEVKASREVRDSLKANENTEILDKSRQASTILHSKQLDARAISDDFTINKKVEYSRGIIGIIFMMIAAPLSIPSTGIQALLGRYLGDNSDEGIDARTTHHMFAAFFSPITIWPLFGISISYHALHDSAHGAELLAAMAIFVFLISIMFHISNLIMLSGYDLWTDFRASLRRRGLAHSEEGETLNNLITSILPQLVALK